MTNQKKFLDAEGVKYLWSKLSLQDYPNNETLMDVIEAIDETKADKSEIIPSDWNQNDETAADYVKNRTHYVSDDEVLVDTQVLIPIAAGQYSGSTRHGATLSFKVGSTYRVYFDQSVAEVVADRAEWLAFSVDSMNIQVTTTHVSVDYPSSTSMTLFKVEKIGEGVKKLDEKFIPETIARVEGVMSNYNPVGTGSFSMNRKAGTSIGYNSHAEGSGTEASGSYSHSEGIQTVASGIASHAEGVETIASESCSHAEGNTTVASGPSSHAEGEYTMAYNIASHAEGYHTEASGYASHAEGIETGAVGSYSHAEGQSTIAFGEISHAEGYYAKAFGSSSHAEGSETIALGDYSHAEGYCEKLPPRRVRGTNSLAANSTFLYISVPKGQDLSSFANTYIEYENNFAFIISVENLGTPAVLPEGGGSVNTTEDSWRFILSNPLSDTSIQNVSLYSYSPVSIALGKAAHAEGINTGAIGITSHAEGYNTIALGEYSHAEGQSTWSNGYHQHVQGKFNIVDNNNKYAHIVGNGTANDARSNAHTLDWSGNAWFAGSLKIGGSGQDDESAQEIATKNYVLEQINNITPGEANIATNEEIIDLLMQLDMLPALTDSDGSMLSDENGNILLW